MTELDARALDVLAHVSDPSLHRLEEHARVEDGGQADQGRVLAGGGEGAVSKRLFDVEKTLVQEDHRAAQRVEGLGRSGA
eukprot:3136219-Rhodomonas_salina.2